ncbi:MAG: GNAT family N-acetyltransferase [Candidatus Acidiferrum sp.]
MSISGSISRVSDYYARHGFQATIRRAGLAARRALFAGRMVVFYCDLSGQTLRPVNIPASMRIDRLTSEAELRPQDFDEITSFWNPKQVRRNIEERFAKGASLWLIKSEDQVAGYGWTLQGRTIAEYYFPLGPKDVQLFDFYVFPKFRGRAMHWLLTAYILQTLAAEGAARAFADTGEWNQAQISSFRMTPFRRLGLVRSFTIFGRTFASWAEQETTEQVTLTNPAKDKALTMARPHE